MKINGHVVVGKEFAYCHKIYIIEDEEDKKEAIDGYTICLLVY